MIDCFYSSWRRSWTPQHWGVQFEMNARQLKGASLLRWVRWFWLLISLRWSSVRENPRLLAWSLVKLPLMNSRICVAGLPAATIFWSCVANSWGSLSNLPGMSIYLKADWMIRRWTIVRRYPFRSFSVLAEIAKGWNLVFGSCLVIQFESANTVVYTFSIRIC